jgi:hypothetical protein
MRWALLIAIVGAVLALTDFFGFAKEGERAIRVFVRLVVRGSNFPTTRSSLPGGRL